MKSAMTLTDEVTISSVDDLRGVSDALADLITKAEEFTEGGEVEHLRVELKTEPGVHAKSLDRTYAQLVVKVSTDG